MLLLIVLCFAHLRHLCMCFQVVLPLFVFKINRKKVLFLCLLDCVRYGTPALLALYYCKNRQKHKYINHIITFIFECYEYYCNYAYKNVFKRMVLFMWFKAVKHKNAHTHIHTQTRAHTSTCIPPTWYFFKAIWIAFDKHLFSAPF